MLLAEEGFVEQRPSFSPDGTKVVFGRCDLNVGEGDSCGIFTIGSDGHQLKTVVPIRLGDTDRSPMKADGSGLKKAITLPQSARAASIKNRVKAGGLASTQRRLKQIEEGGFLPRWGAASE